MSKQNRQRLLIIIVLILLLVGSYVVWRSRVPQTPVPPGTDVPLAPSTTEQIAVPPVKSTGTVLPPKPAPVTPPKAVTPPPPAVTAPPSPPPPPAAKEPPPSGPVSTTVPKPPPITLHKELIPKNIEIVRVYYNREIVGPDTVVGFDINGSGFNSEFENMIQVDPGGLDIQVRNLRMVTANQIHGEMVVGSAQTTDFIYPKILIRNLPVFRAVDPFAVVRPGEVLTIIFMSLSDDGRSGRFRVITNLDETMAKKFSLIPSHAGLQISPLEFRLPFAVEGVLQIGGGVPQGEHGMTAMIGQRQVWERKGMIRIVRPNVGLTGFVQGVSAAEKHHRPGDTVQLYLHGSGLSSTYASALDARVNEMDMGPATFQFISASQMRFTFQVPTNAPLRAYGVTVVDQKNTELYKKDEVFTLVPPNWIRGVQVAPPLRPGQNGLLRVMGRDLDADFVRGIRLTTDDPGISLTGLRQQDASVLVSDIAVSSAVAPGDYWIHIYSQNREIQPPYGSIIKIERP